VAPAAAVTDISKRQSANGDLAHKNGGVRQLKETLKEEVQTAIKASDIRSDDGLDAVGIASSPDVKTTANTSVAGTDIKNSNDATVDLSGDGPSALPSPTPQAVGSHKPPLPPGRSRRVAALPASAQWEQSRPLNQLDAALQQFKRSAAESRENLALSRPDISLIQAGLL
jgi:hypothetical protein